MSNISNLRDHKQKQKLSILEQLKSDIFGNEKPQKNKSEHIKNVKRELRKRGITKYHLTHKDLPSLKRNYSIIFPKLKLAFSASVTDDLAKNSTWIITKIEVGKDTDVLATVNIIIKAIGEENV